MTGTSDPVRPQHYRNSGGVQLIEVVRWLPFSLGNAVKYCYRCEQKESAVQDLEKALWYLEDFEAHPSTVEGAREQLSPAVVEAVLASTAPFEEAACRALLELAHGRTHRGAFEEARSIISGKLKQLQKEQSEAPGCAASQ